MIYFNSTLTLTFNLNSVSGESSSGDSFNLISNGTTPSFKSVTTTELPVESPLNFTGLSSMINDRLTYTSTPTSSSTKENSSM